VRYQRAINKIMYVFVAIVAVPQRVPFFAALIHFSSSPAMQADFRMQLHFA
jgi:hypothetical protein